VLFTALCKYDGSTVRLLKAREFHQIAGRAGRAGYDDAGTVVVQAPDHVIENLKALAKAGDDPKARRKVVRHKPPDRFVSWGQPTFDRLVGAPPETLTSSFSVTHSMLLNILDRPGDGCGALRHLLTDNHEPREAQRRHIRRAIAIYRTLVAAEIVERLDQPDDQGRLTRLTVDLQENFALNQPLGPFAMGVFELLDRESETYALDVISIVEATLDDPSAILRSQESKARTEAIAQMKADGLEYEERMARLDDVTYPKPLAELLDGAWEIYSRGHPWVSEHPVRPKSVVRDLWERAMTFVDFVGFYGLARSEGLVLRYLTDTYRALVQSVPDTTKTDELRDLTEWLGELVRQVDSSLLDEWEQLRHPAAAPDAGGPRSDAAIDESPPPVTANHRAFSILVRNAMFRHVELAAQRRYDDLADLDEAGGWKPDRWRDALAPYFDEHDTIGTGPNARSSGLLVVDQGPSGPLSGVAVVDQGPSGPLSGVVGARTWKVRQVLDDPDGYHEWAIVATVDLDASDEAGVAVCHVDAVARL